MSLFEVLHEDLIKNRYKLLSDYLKNNIGLLNEHETQYYKILFEYNYTPDEIETKFNIKDIESVSIIPDGWGRRCFAVIVNSIQYPTSIRRLAGSKIGSNKNAYIKRAMREAIHDQINNFKNNNPLNIEDICPLKNIKLGIDAQVDHILPFHIIADEWLSNNKNASYEYCLNKKNYILKEPFLFSWSDYHHKKASLRWLSKEGNKIAHLQN